MSIILYGVTSGGTSVPIEVTDEGKLVVDTSNFPTDEFIKQGDDIEAGSITATGTAEIGVDTGDYQEGIRLNNETNGSQLTCYANSTATQYPVIRVYDGQDPGLDTQIKAQINNDGSITAAGFIQAGTTGGASANNGTYIYSTRYIDDSNHGSAALNAAALDGDLASIQVVDRSGGGSSETFVVKPEGSITAAGNKCGFTAAGELFFTSRNQRYKAVVQGGNVMAEEYTRATELQEKAAKLREPRTQDIVSED